MSAPRPRSSWFTFHRPPWQQRLPKRLRLAAEWQFGTLALIASMALLRGEFAAAGFFCLMSLFFFTFFAGWVESRRINNPYAWWAAVIFISAGGGLGVLFSIFPPTP
ncbi:MAG: hypothetical protein ACRD0K_07300 [Egibacteraceae bacterium]